MLEDALAAAVIVLVAAGVAAVYAGSIAWAIGDAQRRGRNGGIIVLFFWLLGPLSAFIWLIMRPKERLVERLPSSYENADDALAAATRLDALGDWDQAISLFEYTADEWPEHAEYARNCIQSIVQKQSLA